MSKLIIVHHEACYDYWVTYKAVENLALQIDFDFCPCLWSNEWAEVPETTEKVIFITHADPTYIKKPFSFVRERCPNVKIVVLGGDTIYCPNQYAWAGKADLHLDTLSECVGRMDCPADLWLWTASYSLLMFMMQQVPNEPDLDSKDNDAVGLFRFATSERQRMVEKLNSLGVKGIYNPAEYDLKKVAQLYARSWVALGTTSSCLGSYPQLARSMKGFRDWFAPFCHTALIYDDHPDVVKGYGGTVPLYPYGDMAAAAQLISQLKNERDYYLETLKKQRAWSWENTMENQFYRLFKKHHLL